MDLVIDVLVAVIFSTFFDKVRVTFISSGHVLTRVSGRGGKLARQLLSLFCGRPGKFIDAVLINGGVTLMMCNVLVTHLFSGAVFTNLSSNIGIAYSAVLSALVILFANRFLPGALFGSGPGQLLSVFDPFTCLYCIVL